MALPIHALVLYGSILLVLAGAVVAPAVCTVLVIRSGSSPWGLLLPVTTGAYLGLLAANVIDVSRWSGRAIYGLLFLVAWLLLACGAFAFGRLASAARAGTRAWLLLLQGWMVTAIALLMVETAFRIFPAYDSLANNPGIEFFWPDWIHFPLNNFGHRDRDFVTEKADTVYRILLLGDSFTEGAGLDREETFGRLLEASLTERLADAGTAQVYNLGHCGLNTRDEVALLARDGPQLAPDLVVLSYVVVNDAETHPLTVAFSTAPAWVAPIHNVFLQRLRSYGYYWLHMHVTLFPPAFRDAEDLAIATHDPRERGWRDVLSALDELEAWLGARQVPAIALIWPFLSDDWRARGMHVHRQVSQELARRGFQVHDLLDQLSEHPLRTYALSPIDTHPNALANRAVADRLTEIVWNTPSMQGFAAAHAQRAGR